MCDNIKVVVKVRPLIRRELEDKLVHQWRVNDNALIQIDQNGKECGGCYTFDQVYDEGTKTSEVYNNVAKPIVEAAIAGFNGTIFAYGQTSSGKTYTMTGTDDSPGIIPLAVLNLFDIIKNVPDRDFLVRVSFVEIYNETLVDLLSLKKKVKIHDTFQGVKVDATEKLTTSPEEVLEIMRQGKANRQTGATNMNDESSRSHSIFQITIESREHIEGEEEVGSVNVSQLNLVDLAGSERSGQTGATGLRFKEGTHINKSLSALALVIKQLSEDRNKHANYRDSKLTRILQNSLGGNAKTSIICAVTPAAVEETISTLQFANRAKAIKNTPAVNAVATDVTMIQSLTKQLSSLKTQLESKRNVEQDNVNLQKQIGNLQRLILNGFGQRNNMEIISGARRKLHQPRRVTISTLHPIQEDALPAAPKFCTPSLKYNPMSLCSLSELVSIQSATSLCNVEEEPRLITPPPTGKKVTINEEIIEIDSDDDSSIDVPSCSPYHGCFETSKTPPCILRKNAQIAEKDLREIEEFTKREKIYAPDVVQQMEKLESQSIKIAQLEEKINKLQVIGTEKDGAMEQLKSKISKVEEHIKDVTNAKANLESDCKNHTTKLIDLEVSYETLKKKAKSREEELLSLLEEHEGKKKNEKIGKTSSKAVQRELAHIMDTSRDMSLVDSVKNTSIINVEKLPHNTCLNKDLEAQLSLKDQQILQLQTRLDQENVKIARLESINREFQDNIFNLKEKILLIENEHALQKFTIKNLNCTIESQKSTTELLKTDIDSYNDIIKDLKLKLSDNDIFLKSVSESDFETMIANEEMFIANNENMKNIIQCFKTALDVRNMEIENLKLSLNNTTTEKYKSLQEELENKKQHISVLANEIETLNEQMKVNVAVVDNYVIEKNNFMALEQQLNSQLSELQTVKGALEKSSEENLLAIVNLKKCQQDLTLQISAKVQLALDKEKLQRELVNLSKEVVTLQTQMKTKDGIIAELQKEENVRQEVPLMMDNLVTAFSMFCDYLTSLENIAKDVVKERNDLRGIAAHHERSCTITKTKIDELDYAVDIFFKGYECFTKRLMEKEIASCDEIANNNTEDTYNDLEYKIANVMNKITSVMKYLNKSLRDREEELNMIKSEFDCKLELETKKCNLLLANILQKGVVAATEIGIVDIPFQSESDSDSIYDNIDLVFDKIVNHVMVYQSNQVSEFDMIKGILSDAKMEIRRLTDENLKLVQDVTNLENNNVDLSVQLKHIQKDSKLNLESTKLMSKCSDLEIKYRQNYDNIDSITDFPCDVQKYTAKHSLDNIELSSPPSLLTICCSRIIEFIQHDVDNSLESCSSSNSDLKYASNVCRCTNSTTFKNLQKENNNLTKRIEQLEVINSSLVKEQAEVQKEVQLLIQNTQDLQKKVVNHRTNLSTLTATTYAENKSLSSQIKFLQHNHNRFFNICQKDIPAFKNQLQDLLILLKYENIQKQNESFKRYSLPNTLENITSLSSKLKNESSFDGDLLMLDTNVTITTCDNTLIGHDQTYLDVTRVCAYNEVACQTSLNEINSCDLLHSQMEIEPLDSIKILKTLDCLKTENQKLRCLVNEYNINKKSNLHTSDKFDSQTEIESVFDKGLINNNKNLNLCHNCNQKGDIPVVEYTHKKEIEENYKKLMELESQKNDIEKKYLALTLEIPSSDILLQKLDALEKAKDREIAKITQTLNKKNKEFGHLQEENNILSNQVMENISELDDLRKEYDSLKTINSNLLGNCTLLDKEMEYMKHKAETEMTCGECKLKNKIIKNLENKLESISHLNLSSGDSSRCNKICTLQSELHAGKEDCIELKEEVTTIKNHLEHGNLSISQTIDLDDHIYSLKEFENINLQGINCMRNVPVNTVNQISTLDKETCLSYYSEKTGVNKESLERDVKLIDVMKMLYDSIETKHANEIENLVNKLKDFEESKVELEEAVTKLKIENTRITKDLSERNCYFESMANVVLHLRNSIVNLEKEQSHHKIFIDFKENFLKVVDTQFECHSADIFELTLQQLHREYTTETQRHSQDKKKLEIDVQELNTKLHVVNDSLSTLKTKFTEKENEYNLLEKQYQKIHEINTAVTLNIVKMEQDLRKQIINSLSKLLETNTATAEIDYSLTTSKLVDSLCNLALSSLNIKVELEKDKNSIKAEVSELKALLEAKDKELQSLTDGFREIQVINTKIHCDMEQKDQEFKTQISKFDNLNKLYLTTVKENDVYIVLIEKLKGEIREIKEIVITKDALIATLEERLKVHNEKTAFENESKMSQLLNTVVNLEKQTNHLKSLNQNITEEKERCSTELAKAHAIIKQNRLDLDKMTTDVLVLKETVKESSAVIDNLKKDFKTLNQSKDILAETNKQLKVEVEEKCHECSRLERNIKTLEKTAQFQNRTIMRFKQHKEKDDKLLSEKDLKLEELTEKCNCIQAKCDKLTSDLKLTGEECEDLKSDKMLLEARISTLEEEIQNKRRLSFEAVTETSRRRRQSMHDSKRMSANHTGENNHADAVFMDVDGDSSSRSTPVIIDREQDSLLSKHDQTDRDEEHSRSSSVQASRRRRQSVHDMRRSVRETPEPHENSRESLRNNSVDCEVTQLRRQLSSCQQELEDLKEKYREVDEECEMCAEYLRERDEQCLNLKKEKRQLENIVIDLREKLKNVNPKLDEKNIKTSIAHVSVNTDEDRMSYDAEVEKNKKLVKLVEELRFKKQDLKTTMAKMQKALEKHTFKDKELEETKASLLSCQDELAELRERYKELDEECETCAAYLRERDEQCDKLKEAKLALEAKLLEQAETSVQSVRKKRHALHDQRRTPTATLADVATDTTDDLLMYNVEKDNSKTTTEDVQNMEMKRLKMALEKMSQQKTELEHQLSSSPLYVATGSAVVQKQQITDVIKENEKLKKINAKLVTICKKRGKSFKDSNRENDAPDD